MIRISTFILAAALLLGSIPAQAGGPYRFYTVAPCKPVNNVLLPNGNQTYQFQVKGTCGVPHSAKAVVFNIAVTDADPPQGLFILYDPTNPPANINDLSHINWIGDQGGVGVANQATIPLAGSSFVEVFAGFGPAYHAELTLHTIGYYR